MFLQRSLACRLKAPRRHAMGLTRRIASGICSVSHVDYLPNGAITIRKVNYPTSNTLISEYQQWSDTLATVERYRWRLSDGRVVVTSHSPEPFRLVVGKPRWARSRKMGWSVFQQRGSPAEGSIGAWEALEDYSRVGLVAGLYLPSLVLFPTVSLLGAAGRCCLPAANTRTRRYTSNQELVLTQLPT